MSSEMAGTAGRAGAQRTLPPRRAGVDRPRSRLAMWASGHPGGLLVALALYTALILLMAHPLVGALDRSVPALPGKRLESPVLQNLWTVAWSTHALGTTPATVFHANIFYPEPYALAYSDHYFGVVPFFALFWGITGSLVAAFNTYYLVSFILTGLATFALVRAWTGSVPAALFAGVAFAFAPPRMAHYYHVQLQAIWWTPLALLLTERFLQQPTPGRAALATAAFVMQWLSSFYLGWLLTFALAVYLVAAAVGERRLLGRRPCWLYGLPAIAIAGMILLPTLLPYLIVRERWDFRWALTELASHSASPANFLSVSWVNWFYTPLLKAFSEGVGAEKQLFLGLSPIALSIVGVASTLRRRSREAGRPRGLRWLALTLAALAGVSLILTFGPYAGTPPTIPLPYLWLYEWVPGFAGMRNPGRFIFPVALALAVLSGLGVAALLDRLRPGRPRWIAGGALLLVLTVELFSVVTTKPIPTPDAQALGYLRETAADGPIVELPISRGRAAAETPRMVASAAHWRPLVNGSSSFRPPTYETLGAVLQRADPWAMADTLQVLGIRTLVLHLDELTPDERARFAADEWAQAGFVEQFRTRRTAIWTLHPRRTPELTRDVEVEIRVPRPAAGGVVPVRLLLLTEEGRIFYDPVGGARPVRVEWLPLEQGGAATRHDLAVALPRVVVPKPQVKAEFSVPAPPQPGPYRMVVHTEHWAEERTVMVSPASEDD